MSTVRDFVRNRLTPKKIKDHISGTTDPSNGHAKGGKIRNRRRNNTAGSGGREETVRDRIEREESPPSSDSSRSTSRAGGRKSLDEFVGDHECPELRGRYGKLPLIQSQEEFYEPWTPISSITSEMVDQEVTFRARVHAVRQISANLVFLVFRERMSTIQGVLEEEEGRISEAMVRWAEHIPPESIVMVKGKLRRAEQEVKTATVHELELQIERLYLVSERTKITPFSVYRSDVADDYHVADRVRQSNRILDLRTPTSQAIFRIQSGVCNLFRSFLDSKGFIEIHTPKLQGGATEGGASVFRLDYFGRPAFLAQSPQLAKQMCIAADFERVYEIGPVFRAEDSNTPRHMTEYTGLDMEMSINTHYHEGMRMIDETLKSVFKGVYDKFRPEIEKVKLHFPHEDLVWHEETTVLTFADGVKMLCESGWKDENGEPPSEHEDLATKAEKKLGELVKEKFHTDYYILDKFPTSARPFYTMLDPGDDQVTNSFDFFVRGQEILSGGQRIHNAALLTKRLKSASMDPEALKEYVEGFEWAAPPHAGAGVGLERLVSLILGLGNVRHATLFHRDPRSFNTNSAAGKLRHPEDNTLHRPRGRLPPLENLVANYGDATNTSWMDERFEIWRHHNTGAAVAYVKTNDHAILPGNPLCDTTQYSTVIGSFLHWLHTELHLKPVWVLAGQETEEVLTSNFEWRSLSSAAEQRVNLIADGSAADKEVERKTRQAKHQGIEVANLGNSVPEEIQEKCNARIKDWQDNRTGTQVHLSEITPWKDMAHRHYFYAHDKDGQIHALVVLAQLAPRYGCQVKWALDFPGAPSGTIEYATVTAMKTAATLGYESLTFGGGATSELMAGHNIGDTKITALDNTYQAIAARLKLNQKTDFRAKFQAKDDPVFICYPKHGLGVGGVRAILDFFQNER